MCPAMIISTKANDDALESQYQKGVKQLCENGINKVPNKYILPVQERPDTTEAETGVANQNLKLPIIDFAELQGPNRPQVLTTLANACEQYGFFLVRRHKESRPFF